MEFGARIIGDLVDVRATFWRTWEQPTKGHILSGRWGEAATSEIATRKKWFFSIDKRGCY
jgi:hypothetical protein